MQPERTVVDVNASLGNWPFRHLRGNDAESLVRLMDSVGIAESWVASFDCVLNREPKTANLALARSLEAHRDRLRPFATVNPRFPTWERDVGLYLDELRMAGFRVYPNYHGYALDDPCFLDLLCCAQERRVPVQIAVRVADERMHHPLVKVPATELPRLQATLGSVASVPVILLNVRQGELAAAADLASSHAPLAIEISHVETVGGVARLFERGFGLEQVLFGSHAPLLYPHSAVFKLRESDLSPQQRRSIECGNARRVVGAA